MTEVQTQSSSTPNIQQILRQAELQQVQLQLEVNFKRNMTAFKSLAPQIYQQYIDYDPQELRLIYTEEGYLNLVNFKLDNKPVYKDNPESFCREQYQAFKANPALSNIKFGKTKIHNKDHIHPQIVNRLIDFYQECEADQRRTCDVPIGFMLVTGCGLGYHIREMVNDLDIYNLCIFDPHKDSFYASLHAIDWVPILEKTTNKGRMLKLYIGVDPHDAMADMKLLTDKIGLFNFVYTFIYRHFNSKKENEFTALYRKEFHLAAAGTGFYDDEQISLAHTVYNINSGFRYLHAATNPIVDIPVFLIGNGPSLDQHIAYIKEHQDKAIIVTCGTALSSLAKTGIKPDFHIEMERSAVTPSYIKHGTSKEYREGITLICLNTAAPQMTELFNDVCLAIKPNDLGTYIVEATYPDLKHSKVNLCNPTVTNAGLSCMLSLGFRNLVFLGIDLGMREDSQHHSSLSIYYDIEKKRTEEKTLKKSDNYLVDGNFGGKVSTNAILHASKSNMEILLRQARGQGFNVTVLNPNDGALIKETQTIMPEDLPHFENLTLDKQALITAIKRNHMIHYPAKHLSDEDFRKNYLRQLSSLKSKISLPDNIDSPDSLHRAMQFAFKAILSADPIYKLLFRGSINSAFTVIIQILLFSKDKNSFIKRYKKARSIYAELISQAFKNMEAHPLQCDTTVDTEAVRLK